MKIIPLKYDFCITEVMENETVRKYFTSNVLGIPIETIKTVRITNTSLWKRRQKQGVLDVQLELNDATKINIEMRLKQKKDWDQRTAFYLAKPDKKLDVIKLEIRNWLKKIKEINITDDLRFAYDLGLQAKRDREAEDEFVFE